MTTMTYLSGGLATILGICAAMFSFLSKAQHADERGTTRRWFYRKWRRVSKTPWRTVPEVIVHWLVLQKGAISNCANRAMYSRFGLIQIFGLPLWVGLGVWAWRGTPSAMQATFFALLGTAGDYYIQTRGLGLEHGYTRGRNILESIVYPSLGVSWWICLFAWSFVLTSIPLSSALLLVLIVVPLVGSPFGAPSMIVQQWSQALLPRLSVRLREAFVDDLALFEFSGLCSYIFSFYAVFLGTLTSSSPPPAISCQLLVSNVFFDALTVVVSLAVLAYATRSPSGSALLVVGIGIDLALAAVFACLALYVGQLGSDNALSILEVFHLFLATSRDGSSWEIGPYFWLMHTTFIPVLLVSFVVSICWMSQAALRVVEWLMAKGKDSDEPLGYVAAFFTLLAALFGSLSYALAIFKD